MQKKKVVLNVELSDYQAQVICDALEYYSRVAGMGQMEHITCEHRWKMKKFTSLDDVNYAGGVIIPELKKLLFGLDANASMGIAMADKEFRVAFDIQQAIRQYLAWGRKGLHPKKDKRDWSNMDMIGVHYDDPYITAPEESLPIVKFKDE